MPTTAADGRAASDRQTERRAAVAVARSGTLRHRFVGTAAEGRVHAKTGTMTAVSALSGYLQHPNASDFGSVTFSLLANGGPGSGGRLRPFQDAMIVQTALARAC